MVTKLAGVIVEMRRVLLADDSQQHLAVHLAEDLVEAALPPDVRLDVHCHAVEEFVDLFYVSHGPVRLESLGREATVGGRAE